MPTDNADSETPAPKPSKESTLVIFSTIGDTTWRLFVPSVGGTLLGVWGDKSFASKPWLTVIGIAIGCTLAVLLVRRQYRQIEDTLHHT